FRHALMLGVASEVRIVRRGASTWRHDGELLAYPVPDVLRRRSTRAGRPLSPARATARHLRLLRIRPAPKAARACSTRKSDRMKRGRYSLRQVPPSDRVLCDAGLGDTRTSSLVITVKSGKELDRGVTKII